MTTQDLQQVIEKDRLARQRRQRMLIGLGLGLATILGILGWQQLNQPDQIIQWKTAPVERQTLVIRVAATGKLQPTIQVDVGSELSGIIESVLVDDNDPVKAGQILARLDISRLEDTVRQAEANLSAARARVLQAQATLEETMGKLNRLQKIQVSGDGQLLSADELASAEANMKRAQAEGVSAQAAISQAEAELQSAVTNLKKATIRSPIQGVVLSRLIDPGQTVAASFNAPVLFTLAGDLSRMQLLVDIDEADVGKVSVGQKATFNVDAWPGRMFPAMLSRVGYGAVEKDGVVTYPAILDVDNRDLSLRPGMTATADITTRVIENARVIPNAALRFTPPPATNNTSKGSGGITGLLIPKRFMDPPRKASNSTPGKATIWALEQGQAVAVEIATGASDGQVTEVLSGDLQDSAAVIIEASRKQP